MLPPSDPVKDYLGAPLAQYKILFPIFLPSLTRHIISVIFCLSRTTVVKLQSERYDNLYQHNIFKTTSNQSVEFVMERICTVQIEEVIFASTSKM